MADFTSALHLGFLHSSCELRPWTQFTTGIPAALGFPEISRQVAQDIAELQGCEQAAVAPSTLHVFWDLFALIAGPRTAILLDRGTYPIARWGVERAAARGVPVRMFAHHSPRSLQEAAEALGGDRRTLIVADGFCPTCGQCAPIAQYLNLAQRSEGYLIIDDTQALGIFGQSPNSEAPYGKGGGGMLRMANVRGPNIVMVSSMAKAFGVPVAVLASTSGIVEHFKKHSETRVHCSPPSVAVLHAAEHALHRNRIEGDTLRLRLAQLVQFFREQLIATNLAVTPTLFPFQSLSIPHSADPIDMHGRLLRAGVRCVLHRPGHDGTVRLSFLITARHTFEDLIRAVNAIFRLVGPALQSSFI